MGLLIITDISAIRLSLIIPCTRERVTSVGVFSLMSEFSAPDLVH